MDPSDVVQQTLFQAHRGQGDTLAEIAEQMDRSPAAVADLLKRGMRKLRELIREPE